MNNAPTSFYIHVPVDVPHVLMKHVIGKNGKWFHLTTQHTGVSGIWFNKTRSIVEIWGPVQHLVCAAYAIQNRINYVKHRFKDCVDDDTNDAIQHTWPNDEYFEVPLTTDEYHLDPSLIKHLIGKDGRHFKKITRDSGVSFLWYHAYRNCVQVWGPSTSIPQAAQMIQQAVLDLTQQEENSEMVTTE